jgi:tyrosyl-tRNA synthetase
MKLAKTIVAMYHSAAAADAEEDVFNKKFRDRNLTLNDLAGEVLAIGPWRTSSAAIYETAAAMKLDLSKTEVRRRIMAGAVSVDGQTIGLDFICEPGEHLVKLGKKAIGKILVDPSSAEKGDAGKP